MICRSDSCTNIFTISRKKAYSFSLVLLLIAGFTIGLNQVRINQISANISFNNIPLNIDGWKGVNDVFKGGEKIYSHIGADVTMLRHYIKDNLKITIYVGYYPEVREGKRPHATISCYAGQGWSLVDESYVTLASDRVNLLLKRLLLRQGDNFKRVYYWFENSNGKAYAKEIKLKKDLFLNKIKLRNADIAFIRVSAIVNDSDMIAFDNEILSFIEQIEPYIKRTLQNKG